MGMGSVMGPDKDQDTIRANVAQGVGPEENDHNNARIMSKSGWDINWHMGTRNIKIFRFNYESGWKSMYKFGIFS